MLTLLTFLLLSVVLFFIIRKLVRQRLIIHRLRGELKRHGVRLKEETRKEKGVLGMFNWFRGSERDKK